MAAGQGGIGGRIEGLDLWRAVLMLFGLMYHGVMLRPETPVFTAVTLISNSCRMGLFFGISGLVVARSLRRHPPGRWLARRLVGIGVPAAFGLAVICPLTAWSFHLVPPAQRMPGGFPQWYHLWFLVALLLYSPVGQALHRFDARHRLFAAMAADARLMRHAQPLAMLVVTLVGFALMQLAVAAVIGLAPRRAWSPLMQLRPTAGYLPMFVLGFAIGRSDTLRLAFTRRLRLPLLLAGAVAIAELAWFAGGAAHVAPASRDWLQTLLLEAGSALCPPALLVPLLRSAFAIRRVPPALMRLACASFTIYLVHFPIMVAVNGLFTRLSWNEYLEWGIAVATTLALSGALHELLVERSPVAALLLNGVLPERRPVSPSTEPAEPIADQPACAATA